MFGAGLKPKQERCRKRISTEDSPLFISKDVRPHSLPTIPTVLRVVPGDCTASAIARIHHCKLCLRYHQQSRRHLMPTGKILLIEIYISVARFSTISVMMILVISIKNRNKEQNQNCDEDSNLSCPVHSIVHFNQL